MQKDYRHRTCGIHATGLLLGLILTIFPGGRDCGIRGTQASFYPTDDSGNPAVPLSAPSAIIPLPHIIRTTERSEQSRSPYLSGLSSSSRCSRKVTQSARGLGTVHIEATGSSSKPSILGDRRDETGGLFFVRHSDLVNRRGWHFEHAYGDQNAKLDELILSSNRFSFSNTKMRGITGVAHKGRTHVSWAVGNVGKLSGSDANQFELTDEDISGFGINHRLNRRWQLSAQLWTVSGGETAEYQSLATVARYADTESRSSYSVHLINDSNSQLGVWFDMDLTRDKWRHLYSLYRFDSDLVWSTVNLPDDRQGAYWQTEYEFSDFVWSGGLELEQTNLDQDKARAGHIKTRGFSNFAQAFSNITKVKGQVSAEEQRSYAGLTGKEARRVKLGVSLEQQLGIGESRFDVLWSTTYAETNPQDTVHMCWDQDWRLMDKHKLTTRIALDKHTQDRNEAIYPAAAFILSRSMSRKIELTSSLYYVIDDERSPRDMNPWVWCNGQIGCLHGTGGSVWMAMKASLD